MKRIPEAFELDQEDIAAAITEWLRYKYAVGDKNASYAVTFTTEEVTMPTPPGTLSGGMSDNRKLVIKAKAVKQ